MCLCPKTTNPTVHLSLMDPYVLVHEAVSSHLGQIKGLSYLLGVNKPDPKEQPRARSVLLTTSYSHRSHGPEGW